MKESFFSISILVGISCLGFGCCGNHQFCTMLWAWKHANYNAEHTCFCCDESEDIEHEVVFKRLIGDVPGTPVSLNGPFVLLQKQKNGF